MLRSRPWLMIIALLALAIPAQAAMWQWSKTPSSNATADPSVNWSIGMAPSAVDASGRAMMARTAENRDDISGLLSAGGTATAYTVTTNQGLPATPNDGQLLGFTPTNTNGAGVTLSADSGGVFPIQSSAGTGISSGSLVSGTPYTVKFSASASAWVVRNFFGSPFTVPIGAMLPYTGTTSPNSNFIFPAGQCISRTTYAAYFVQVSTTYGACDGSTTFGVPDMRGRTIAAIDNLGGTAANRLTTTYFGSDPTVVGDAGGSQSHTLTQSELSVSLGTATSTVTDPGHSHVETAAPGSGGLSGVAVQSGASAQAATNYTTLAGTTGISVATTITNAGGGNPHAIVPPMIVLSYILRVL